MMLVRSGFLASLLFLGIGNRAIGQQGREQVGQIENLRDQARAEHEQLEKQALATRGQVLELQKKLVIVGARISNQNQRSVEAEEHLLVLQAREKRQRDELFEDQEAISEILAALQRSEMSPPPPLAVSPGDTLAAARASMLMSATVPELQIRADALRASLSALQAVRQEINASQIELQKQTQTLADEQRQLQVLLNQRQIFEARLRADAKTALDEAKSLAQNANNLRELIRQLEIEASKSTPSIKPKPPQSKLVLAPRLKPRQQDQLPLLPLWQPSTGRFSDSRGHLDFPVLGEVVDRFGRSKNPDKADGMVFRTLRRAQIIAPFDARVAFAGEFRNFGQLLILDVGEGYHMVLAGFSVTYVVKGQTVLAGEPIGKMANRRKPAPEFYLEFRNKGQPFDPEPWLKKAINAG